MIHSYFLHFFIIFWSPVDGLFLESKCEEDIKMFKNGILLDISKLKETKKITICSSQGEYSRCATSLTHVMYNTYNHYRFNTLCKTKSIDILIDLRQHSDKVSEPREFEVKITNILNGDIEESSIFLPIHHHHRSQHTNDKFLSYEPLNKRSHNFEHLLQKRFSASSAGVTVIRVDSNKPPEIFTLVSCPIPFRSYSFDTGNITGSFIDQLYGVTILISNRKLTSNEVEIKITEKTGGESAVCKFNLKHQSQKAVRVEIEIISDETMPGYGIPECHRISINSMYKLHFACWSKLTEIPSVLHLVFFPTISNQDHFRQNNFNLNYEKGSIKWKIKLIVVRYKYSNDSVIRYSSDVTISPTEIDPNNSESMDIPMKIIENRIALDFDLYKFVFIPESADEDTDSIVIVKVFDELNKLFDFKIDGETFREKNLTAEKYLQIFGRIRVTEICIMNYGESPDWNLKKIDITSSTAEMTVNINRNLEASKCHKFDVEFKSKRVT